jgi:hypothetical protein
MLRGSGLLCYPSSLNSPSHTQDSAGSDGDCDKVCGDEDDDEGSDEGDSMRTSMDVGGGLQEGTSATFPTVVPTPEVSDRASDAALAGSVASECPNQKLYMQQHPPTFTLEHLIPVGLKFLISFSKNDLLVQGTQAMCSFDVEVETKVPWEGGTRGVAGAAGDEGEADEDGEDEGADSRDVGCSDNLNTSTPPHRKQDKDMSEENGNSSLGSNAAVDGKVHKTNKQSISTTATLVTVPGALAYFSFDQDILRGSKIQEACFDLDINATALSFLDHAQILHEYFGSALSGGKTGAREEETNRSKKERGGEIATSYSSVCHNGTSSSGYADNDAADADDDDDDDADDDGDEDDNHDDGIHMECEEVSTI